MLMKQSGHVINYKCVCVLHIDFYYVSFFIFSVVYVCVCHFVFV